MKQMFKSTIVAFVSVVVVQSVCADQDVRAFWRMNDGVGATVTDSSGNGNTLIGTNMAWSGGINSPAIVMKSNGLIQCPNSESLNPADAITVEAWVNPWNPNYKDSPTFVHKEGAYRLGFSPGSKVGVTFWIHGTPQTLTSERSDFPKSHWVYVAATYDGKKIVLYIDGKKDSERAVQGTLDGGTAPLYIGSDNGKHILWNAIDDVRISGTAFDAGDIAQTHQAGRYLAARQSARHAAFWNKGEKRQAKEVVPGYIWIDAEDFQEYGGWWLETQFVPQVGSPYLMAAGTGEPVADATTTVTLERPGTYKLWVRNRNWLKDYQPGTFNVVVNGQTSATEFGTQPLAEWVWQDGGTFELKAGEVELKLHDLTGYYGRCDALILTRDMHYVPPFVLEGYKGEQRRLTGRGADEVTAGTYDVVVVGAGAAGINAAISSARAGAKTVLIQSRPMIGGNNSPEMGVPILGPADYGQKNAREGGLNEEIGRLRSFNFMLKWSQGAELAAAAETNLTIVLNTYVYDVERTAGNHISAVRAFDMIDGHLTKYNGQQFIDCTGDGWVGYFAGAQVLRGREPRWLFHESQAPEDGDIFTMSGSIFHAHTLGYASVDTGAPVTYNPPAWVWDLSDNTEALEARKGVEDTYKSGTWWHENRNDVDDLWDPEAARDGLIRVSVSYWNWVKNISPMFREKAANRKLIPLPVTNAKRETRRLVGDVIVTQDDVLNVRPWKDRIGYGGWGLDIHHPEGIFSKEGPFDFNTHTPLHNLPFRMLYSRNVPNLMMAGRDISCTHVALGTMRVQGTTGQMGQAVGTAAAMCIRYGTNPRGIYQNHMSELQQQLLKDDQYIIGLKNEDAADLARHATVTASSSMAGDSFQLSDMKENGTIRRLDVPRAMMFRRGDSKHIHRISALLFNANKVDVEVTMHLRSSDVMGDFSSKKDIKKVRVRVPAGKLDWVDFDVDCDVKSNYVWFEFPKTEGVSWNMMDTAPVGGCSAVLPDTDKTWQMNSSEYYAFHLDAPITPAGLYEPENVISGVSRIVGDTMNMWRSNPKQALPQWLELNFGAPKKMNSVYLTFDTDMNDAKRLTWEMRDTERMVPECVRDYTIMAYTGSEWVTLVTVKNNYQRHRIHRFPETTASRLKVVVEHTNGDESARIFEIRAYDE